MEQFIYKKEYKYLTSAMLNVTDDCNLECKYCFVEQHPNYMSLDIAKKSADWLYNNLQEKLKLYPNLEKICHINFFGGEPMLCYSTIIVPLVEYCNLNYPNIFEFGMTTNGTLLNKEKIDFLKKNNFNLLLSIDGNKDTQNFNRPCRNKKYNSFDLIEKNIPYLLENFPNICFRSTLYPPTIKYLYENYLYAESLGFKNYEIIEDNRSSWSEDDYNILKDEILKIYSHIIYKLVNEELPMNVGRINLYTKLAFELLTNNNLKNNKRNININRCGLATTNGAIGWDGSLYGCQEQVSKKIKNIFYIGNLLNGGIDEHKHNELLSKYYYDQVNIKLNKVKCENCFLKNFCLTNNLSCPSLTFDLFKTMNNTTDISCYLRQLYTKNSIIFIQILLSLDIEFVNNYINNILLKEGWYLDK